ncbi:putative nonsense-mediated mRNA decay protein Upf3 [Aspergillus saccharolyticus JOP 1030-1]|uniref:RRM domain-containing protein n=1 Tax=Aspergillus saccharolyticus JOP 1030-1 TaxID=1450539 RepID=A0A318ZQF1_9EURO|nr:hypothetical protein BP01DRAFT_4065 [Aspergillus saccharolyticus JOP 1030-1]PYH49726.1 hypothetical protein BP01DRAFT_4065 [Aspergillus saccharolyticus JOP 1030-1]
MTQILTGKSAGGVLQVPAAATQKNASATTKKAPKPPVPRLKLIIRRLPPGLTQAEFETALGPDWKTGAGKVDWFVYKPGKVSKEYNPSFPWACCGLNLIVTNSSAKPSRPSRAYIRVVSGEHTLPLSTHVRQTSFQDARNTFNDNVLVGPPSVEFAPFAKTPGSRSRKDARQGTIDQDPDFITFLESLTQPIAKPSALDSAADAEDKKDAVLITPLVQYIKDKKANKAKESSKSSRHKSDKDSKSEKVQAKKLLQRSDKEVTQPAAAEKTERKSRSERATREAVKVANKQAASVASKQAAKSSGSGSKDSPKDTPQPTSERKRERGNLSAAAKIVQRDLGLAPAGGRRRGGKGTATAGSEPSKNEQANATTSEPPKKEASSRSSKDANSSQSSKGRGRGHAQQQSNEPSEAGTPPVSIISKPSKSKGKPAPAAAAATATQAFLKHANPSQGVTEPLLETAFAAFGKVTKVEIDKKKGFGYVDFAEPEGLQKAMAASPVTVAQSQVVVLERKANPGGEKGRGKGGRGDSQSNTGGGNANTNNSKSEKASEGKSGGNSSRGPRGGRGSKGKGGSKGGSGGNANANVGNTENKGSADAK